MNEDRGFCVYKHTNKINGKVYIGQTCCHPVNRRWQNGYGYRRCVYFYRAIEKYGWDGFYHCVLYDNLTFEEANNLEKKLISDYRSNESKYGYNITDGGANGRPSEDVIEKRSAKKRIPVVQLTLTGQFVKEWSCANEASKCLHISDGAIRCCCNRCEGSRQRTAGGYIWINKVDYESNNYDMSYYRSVITSTPRPVGQYDKSGNMVAIYKSIADAKIAADVKNIVKCCTGERPFAGGFAWKYLDER